MRSPHSIRSAFLLIFTLVLLFFSASNLRAETSKEENRDNILSPSAQVLLVTVGPGDLVWERFGHNGIWIRDPDRGLDRIYHWGLFSFQSKNFWPQFMRGYMEYAMGSEDPEQFMEFNARNDRSIWLQEVNLTSTQKNDLARRLMKNDTDENRYYQYDYYLDNCSTRARNALDRVLGGIIAQSTGDRGSGTSFRSNTRRLLQDLPAAYFGIQLGLGQPADEEISIWKEMFTPMALRRQLNEISLSDGSPLILSDKTVYRSSTIIEAREVKSFLPTFLSVGIFIGLFLVILGYLSAAGWKSARVGLAFTGSVWGLLCGFSGILLLIIWLFTEHRFGHWNENLLHYSPLSLVVAFSFLRLLIRGRLPRIALPVISTVALLSVIGLGLKVFPYFDQVNTEVISIALPIHLGLVMAVRSARRFEQYHPDRKNPG